MKRRLAIYFHYDPQGQVDTACRIAVDALCHHTEKIWFVTNGTLQPTARAWAVQCGAALLERENTGYDAGAYRDALLAIGRQTLAGYDEVIFLNYTLAGPVCPLGPMFEAMDARQELDFWGLSRHYAMQSRRFGGAVPEHLQSHWLAVRPALLNSDAFWDYWQTMRLPQSYEQAVTGHELRFTAVFAALGYRWDSYLQTEDLKEVFVNPIMACPRELLAERGSPFFKRRSFFTPYDDELRRTDGLAGRQLYDYLKEHTDYPVDLLVAALLRTQPVSALAQSLHWHYTLRAGGTGQSIEEAGLRVVRLAPPQTGDATADYYIRLANREAEAMLPQIAALFEQEPLLGVAAPALPLWPAAVAAATADWREACGALRAAQPTLPLDEANPPPVPYTGWAVVRLAAYPQGVPETAWLLPLEAQKNGFACASFESTAAQAARVDALQTYMRQSKNAAAVATQLARLAKHQLRGGRGH